MIKVAQIGYGYFGQVITKNLKKHPRLSLEFIYDNHPEQVEKFKKTHPDLKVADSYSQILKSDDIEAVFIVTPPETHYELAKQALKAGKHAFVEKPLTTSSKQAYELVQIAEKKGLTLFVDHLLVYSEAVKFLKTFIDNGEAGEIFYIHARRVNLGLFQYKVDVIWDLAIHDISIIDYLVSCDVERISVFKKKFKDFPREAIANINAELKNGIAINIHVSWLSPVKVREMIIGGSDKMLVYNHAIAKPIQIYDHGVVIKNSMDTDSLYQHLVQYKIGGVFSPELPKNTPLENSINHFLESIETGQEPLTGKSSIINTIQTLEMISKI